MREFFDRNVHLLLLALVALVIAWTWLVLTFADQIDSVLP